MFDDYLQFNIRCCDELLQFLVEMEYNANPFITANFQGDAVVTKKVVCLADLEHGTIIHSKKYNRTFIVGPKRDRWFLLCLYGDTTDMEITIGIDIPSYCRDELVCTIKNNWDNWLE